ncbi:uncharacterized protein [Salvelinus alpinus]|uniref:uncharacterized protein isoform X1 n=1 Tax=Salvelinus alpinus TaxID=8036 RepID=UPI0039FCEC0C
MASDTTPVLSKQVLLWLVVVCQSVSVMACSGTYEYVIEEFCLGKFRLDMKELDQHRWCSWEDTVDLVSPVAAQRTILPIRLLTPVMIHGTKPPVMIHGKKPPVMIHGTKPPVMIHGKKPPVMIHGTKPPVMIHGKKPPVMIHGTKPPVMIHGKKPPVMIHGTKPPVMIHGKILCQYTLFTSGGTVFDHSRFNMLYQTFSWLSIVTPSGLIQTDTARCHALSIERLLFSILVRPGCD